MVSFAKVSKKIPEKIFEFLSLFNEYSSGVKKKAREIFSFAMQIYFIALDSI